MATLTDNERALADEGIERLEAAIIRGIAAGVPAQESIDRHIDAVFANWPAASLVMAERMAELTKWRS